MNSKTMKVQTGGSNLLGRAAPIDGKVLAKIPDGTEIELLDEWCKVACEGKELWVKKEFLADAPQGKSKKSEEALFRFDCNPLDKITITQNFGEDPALYKRWKLKGHHGIDFRTKSKDNPDGNQKVYAVLPGTVMQATYNDNNGNFVRLSHANGAQTVYLHLKSIVVTQGQHVEAGVKLGISGNTGFSGGAHLHFGYRPPNFDQSNGYMGYIDPEAFLV